MFDSRTKTFALSRIETDGGAPTDDPEYGAALQNLTAEGYFVPRGSAAGPYALQLKAIADGLSIVARDPEGRVQVDAVLPLTPFNRASADYAAAYEGYETAVRGGSASRIETAERVLLSLHNEGAAMVRDRLRDNVDIDSGTARRLFTLVHVLIRRRERIL